MDTKNIVLVSVIVILVAVGVYFMMNRDSTEKETVVTTSGRVENFNPTTGSETGTSINNPVTPNLSFNTTTGSETGTSINKDITQKEINTFISVYMPNLSCLFTEIFSTDGFNTGLPENPFIKFVNINDKVYAQYTNDSSDNSNGTPLTRESFINLLQEIQKTLFTYIKEKKDYELFVIAMIGYFTNHFMNDFFMEQYGNKASYSRNGNDIILFLPQVEDQSIIINIRQIYDDIINDAQDNLLSIYPFNEKSIILSVENSIKYCTISGIPTVPV